LPGKLSATLRQREVEAMLDNAKLTHDAPEGPEKAEEAKRLVRTAMYKFALSQITEEEKQRLLTILRPCCPDVFVTPPPTEEQYSVPAVVDAAASRAGRQTDTEEE
jgi:hypothetical protein